MAPMRQVIAGWLMALLGSLPMAALAQPGGDAHAGVAGLHVDGFDVEQVMQLTPGMPLNFSLFGTPGAQASLQIDGARRGLDLHEVQPGIYEGTYTVDAQDRIAPDGLVTATLRRGDEVARSVLEEPLLLGAHAPMADRPMPPARPAPLDESAPPDAGPRRGTPVPQTVVTPAMPAATACADCAVVESIRAVEPAGARSAVSAYGGGLIGRLVANHIERRDRIIAHIVGAFGGTAPVPVLEGPRSEGTRYDAVLRLPNGVAHIRRYEALPPFRVGDTVRLGATAGSRAQRSAAPY